VSTNFALPFDSTIPVPATLSRAADERVNYVAAELSRICEEKHRPRILCLSETDLVEAEAILEQCDFVAAENLNRTVSGRFDFIYSLNALSQIGDGDAQRLLTRLTSLLKPGGRLLLTNFSPEYGTATDGLHLRTEDRVAALIPGTESIGHAIWTDGSGKVVYVEIEN
jgi:cyclopropane fatty-acyl-phospholipid synthase-like methyltransferase